MHHEEKIIEVLERLTVLTHKIMTTQEQLDAAIAALPGQIETAVETAMQPVIAAIQQAAATNGVDLTNEVNALNAIPGTVANAVAAALTPPAAPLPPS